MSAERQRRLATAMIAALLGGMCVYAIRRVDADLYGYLAYGRLFAEHGVPAVDPFAYTSGGTPWVAFEYLAQILLWLAYANGGPAGLIALKCVVGGVAATALWTAIRQFGDAPIVTLPVFLVCTSTASRYFLFRPQLFTFACFAIFVVVLCRFLARGRAPLWMLPLLMLAWVNLHGGFLAGLGAIGLAIAMRAAAAIQERRAAGAAGESGTTRAIWMSIRPLVVTLAAALVATFVNPWGWRLWAYVLHELSHDTNRRYIDEWRPASLTNDPWSAVALTFLVAAVVVLAWRARRSRRRTAGLYPWQWAASAAPLVAMSYLSVRHVPLAAIWCAPVLALLAGETRMPGGASEGGASTPPGIAARKLSRLWLAFTAAAFVPIVFTLQFVITNPRPVIAAGGHYLGARNPCRAVTFMRDRGLAGNVFAPLWWGSFLTWELYPNVRVSMDGRNISAFSGAMVAENLRFYSQAAAPELSGVPLRYDTDYLLVPSNVPILESIANDPRWTRVYADDDAWLFEVKGKPKTGAPGTTGATDAPCDAVLR